MNRHRSSHIQYIMAETNGGSDVAPRRRGRFLWLILFLVALLAGGFWVTYSNLKIANEQAVNRKAEELQHPLEGLLEVSGTDVLLAKNLNVNGNVRITGSLVMVPSAQPSRPVAGQIYYNQSTNELSYFNGQEFVSLVKQQPISEQTVQHTTSTGTSTTNIFNQTNAGLTGTSQPVNAVLIGQGTNTISGAIASGPGLCLVSTSGAPEFSACPASASVTSLNGLTGALNIANASGSGGVVTINDASTAQKGIAQFSSVNFSVTSGAVNTIQDIATSSSPTFTNATLSGDLAVNGSDITSTGALTLKPSGVNNILLGTPDTTGTLLIVDQKTDAGDPTGVLGAIYYNASLGKFRCFELDSGSTGYWRDCMASARTAYYYTNDAFGTGNDNNIKYDAQDGGGFDPDEPPEADHPGIVEAGTGTTTNGWAYIGQNTNQNQDLIFGSGNSWRYETLVKIPSASSALSSVTDRYNIRLGFHKHPFSDAGNTDACYLRYSDNINSGRWQGICAAGGVTSTCDTGVTVAVDIWYRATVVVNAAGTSADFQINGTSGCQVASNIPTTGNGTGWANSINKTAGTASRSIHHDYVEVMAQFGTSR